jgi:hypothetical protein
LGRAILLAVFLAVPAASWAQAPKDPPGKKSEPSNAKALAAGVAAETVAIANGPAAVGLMLGARRMALWGDWPTNVEFWDKCDNIILAARTPDDVFQDHAQKNHGLTLAQILRDPHTYRDKAVHLEGELQQLRRLEPAQNIKDRGVSNVYEALVLTGPLGTSPVSLVVSELPAGVKLGDRLNYRVAFEALFFTKEIQGEKEPRPVPLFIGRTFRLIREPAAPDRTPRARELDTVPSIDDLLAGVEDKTDIPTPKKNVEEFWGYCETILVASRIAPQAFVRAGRANREATFAHVFNSPNSYRGKVVQVVGRLARLRRWESPEYLKQRGISHLYEAWIFDQTQGTNPWCVIFTDLPPGLKVAEKFNPPPRVTVDGFFFKKYRYHAVEDDRYTPLVISRTLRLTDGKPAAAETPGTVARSLFSFLGVLIFVAVLFIIGIVVGLSWYFRRADRQHMSRLAGLRAGPLSETPAPAAAINPFPDLFRATPEETPPPAPGSGSAAAAPPPEDRGFHFNGD